MVTNKILPLILPAKRLIRAQYSQSTRVR